MRRNAAETLMGARYGWVIVPGKNAGTPSPARLAVSAASASSWHWTPIAASTPARHALGSDGGERVVLDHGGVDTPHEQMVERA